MFKACFFSVCMVTIICRVFFSNVNSIYVHPRNTASFSTMNRSLIDLNGDHLQSIDKFLDLPGKTQFRQVSRGINMGMNQLYIKDTRMSVELIEHMREQSAGITLETIRARHNAANTDAKRVAEFETTKDMFNKYYMIKRVAVDIIDYFDTANNFYQYATSPQATARRLPTLCTESSFVRSLVLAMRYHVTDVDLQIKGVRILARILNYIPMQPCHVLYECMEGIIMANGERKAIIRDILEYMSKAEESIQHNPAQASCMVRTKFIMVVLSCVEKFRFRGIMAPELYDAKIMNAAVGVVASMIRYADYTEALTSAMLRVIFCCLTEKNIHLGSMNAQWSGMCNIFAEGLKGMLQKVQSTFQQSQNQADLFPMKLFIESRVLYNLNYKNQMIWMFYNDQKINKLHEELCLFTPLLECGFRSHIDFQHIVRKSFNLLQHTVLALHSPSHKTWDIAAKLRSFMVISNRTVDTEIFVTEADINLQTLFGQTGFVSLAMNKISAYSGYKKETDETYNHQDMMLHWTFFLGVLLYKHRKNQSLFISGFGMENLFLIALQSSVEIRVQILTVLCTTLRDNEVAVRAHCPFFLTQQVEPLPNRESDTTFAKTMAEIANTDFTGVASTTALLQIYKMYTDSSPYPAV